MLVLGIDPGSVVTGYGIVEACEENLECKEYGCIRLQQYQEFYLRLKKIYDTVSSLIKQYDPDMVVFEDVFYGRNLKVVLQLGQARGAAILASVNADKSISIYSPREVKQALTGFGGASKEQVQKMVKSLLNFEKPVTPLDASDALAIAICHINRYQTDLKIRKNVI